MAGRGWRWTYGCAGVSSAVWRDMYVHDCRVGGRTPSGRRQSCSLFGRTQRGHVISTHNWIISYNAHMRAACKQWAMRQRRTLLPQGPSPRHDPATAVAKQRIPRARSTVDRSPRPRALLYPCVAGVRAVPRVSHSSHNGTTFDARERRSTATRRSVPPKHLRAPRSPQTQSFIRMI